VVQVPPDALAFALGEAAPDAVRLAGGDGVEVAEGRRPAIVQPGGLAVQVGVTASCAWARARANKEAARPEGCRQGV
jgi:hypothetical protein